MTTREAFDQLTARRGWHKDLDITDSAAYCMKNNLKKGLVTIDKMEEVLMKAGFIVKQEKLWEK